MTVHEEWRYPKRRRLVAWAFVVGFAGLAVGGGIRSAFLESWWGALPVAVFGLLSLNAYRIWLYPKVTATDDGLIVKNPLHTHNIAWSEIVWMSPGMYGLNIWKTDKRRFIAVAIAKRDGRFMYGEQPQPHQIVDEMSRLAERATQIPHVFSKRPPTST